MRVNNIVKKEDDRTKIILPTYLVDKEVLGFKIFVPNYTDLIPVGDILRSIAWIFDDQVEAYKIIVNMLEVYETNKTAILTYSDGRKYHLFKVYKFFYKKFMLLNKGSYLSVRVLRTYVNGLDQETGSAFKRTTKKGTTFIPM